MRPYSPAAIFTIDESSLDHVQSTHFCSPCGKSNFMSTHQTYFKYGP